MKVLIAAGGTGGHIYPGIAVANEIMRRDGRSEVLFVGDGPRFGERIVAENGFQLSVDKQRGIEKRGLKGLIKGLALLPKGFSSATAHPSVSAPRCRGAAVRIGACVMMRRSWVCNPRQDSNAVPGFATETCMFVAKAALTFKEALPFFEKSVGQEICASRVL